MATEVTELKRRATMINDKVRMYLLPPLINAAVRAGASIMNVYKNLDDYDISLKRRQDADHARRPAGAQNHPRIPGPDAHPDPERGGGARCSTTSAATGSSTGWSTRSTGRSNLSKGNNEFTVNIALMENNVCMGAVDLRALFREAVYRGARMQARMSRSMWRRIPRRNIPTTRSSPGGRACRWGARPCVHPRLRGRVALAPDTRDRRAYRPPARDAPRPGDRRTGQFV